MPDSNNSRNRGINSLLAAILGALAGASAVILYLFKKRNEKKINEGIKKMKEVGNKSLNALKEKAKTAKEEAQKRVSEALKKEEEETS